MNKSDDAILEFLADTGLALPPRAIEYNFQTRYDIDVSYSTINRRLRKLTAADLVSKEYEAGGFYSITELGERYLAGDLDAGALEDIDIPE